MSTNLIISHPSYPVRCFQLNDAFLLDLYSCGSDNFYNHYCEHDDECRNSSPCLKSPMFHEIISRLYNIDKDAYYLIINGKIGSHNNELESQELSNDDQSPNIKDFITIDVLFRLLGGKGGFGKILKTQSSKKRQSTNQDSCRNLQGQRIRTVRIAEQMNKWNEKESKKENVDESVYKLPKKAEPEEPVQKDDYVDRKYVETVRKEAAKVKNTVLRGFDAKVAKESAGMMLANELEAKRSNVLDACLDVYEM